MTWESCLAFSLSYSSCGINRDTGPADQCGRAKMHPDLLYFDTIANALPKSTQGLTITAKYNGGVCDRRWSLVTRADFVDRRPWSRGVHIGKASSKRLCSPMPECGRFWCIVGNPEVNSWSTNLACINRSIRHV